MQRSQRQFSITETSFRRKIEQVQTSQTLGQIKNQNTLIKFSDH